MQGEVIHISATSENHINAMDMNSDYGDGANPLFDKLRIVEKAKKTKTGQYVTSEEVLESLRGKHEIVGKILEHRGPLPTYRKNAIIHFPKLPS